MPNVPFFTSWTYFKDLWPQLVFTGFWNLNKFQNTKVQCKCTVLSELNSKLFSGSLFLIKNLTIYFYFNIQNSLSLTYNIFNNTKTLDKLFNNNICRKHIQTKKA